MKILLLFVLFLINSFSSIGQSYTIDNYFKAYFPGKPILTTNNEHIKMVSYSYTDDSNVIIYNGTYSILAYPIKQSERKIFLKQLLDDHVKSVKGQLVKKEFKQLDNNDAIIYTIKYLWDDESIIKYGISVLKNDVIYNWAVQEIVNYSLVNAEKNFENNLKYFKILK